MLLFIKVFAIVAGHLKFDGDECAARGVVKLQNYTILCSRNRFARSLLYEMSFKRLIIRNYHVDEINVVARTREILLQRRCPDEKLEMGKTRLYRFKYI